MEVETRKHWCRFSLRTLFAVMAVLGVWLGWNVNRIAYRKSVKATIEAHGGHVHPHYSAAELIAAGETCGVAIASASLCKAPTIPVTRKWLGDKPVSSIRVRSKPDGALALEAFPETNEIIVLSEDLEEALFYTAPDGQ